MGSVSTRAPMALPAIAPAQGAGPPSNSASLGGATPMPAVVRENTEAINRAEKRTQKYLQKSVSKGIKDDPMWSERWREHFAALGMDGLEAKAASKEILVIFMESHIARFLDKKWINPLIAEEKKKKKKKEDNEEDKKLNSFYKTRPCHAFNAGMCQKGAHCTYAHGDAELRGNLAKRRRDKPRQLCKAHYENRCGEPDVCKNAHTVHEFVAPLDSDEEDAEKRLVKKEKKLKKIMELQQIDQEMMYYRTSLCRFAKGSCWFGNFCFYAHDKSQLRSGPDDPKGMPGTDAFDFDLSGQTAMEQMAASGMMPGLMPGMPPLPTLPGMPPLPTLSGMPPMPGMPGLPDMPGMPSRDDRSPRRERRNRSRSRDRRDRDRDRDRDRRDPRRQSDPPPGNFYKQPAPQPSPNMAPLGARRQRIEDSDL